MYFQRLTLLRFFFLSRNSDNMAPIYIAFRVSKLLYLIFLCEIQGSEHKKSLLVRFSHSGMSAILIPIFMPGYTPLHAKVAQRTVHLQYALSSITFMNLRVTEVHTNQYANGNIAIQCKRQWRVFSLLSDYR